MDDSQSSDFLSESTDMFCTSPAGDSAIVSFLKFIFHRDITY